MKTTIDLAAWRRKEHFLFFKAFNQPFFSVTVSLPVEKAYLFCKRENLSFFLYYLYQSLHAVNAVDAFKLRIEQDSVYLFDVINASPTINRPDGTFGFAYIDYFPDITQFFVSAQKEISRVQNSTTLIPAITGENIIHYSTLPWINFTALTHASHTEYKDSIPKITFGKMTGEPGHRVMPVSVHAHHALMDGVDMGRFIDLFTELLHRY